MTKTKARPDERMGLMLLSTIMESIDGATVQLSERLKNDPYAVRGLKAARTNIKKAIDAAIATIEQDSIDYIVKNSKGYELVIRQKRITSDPCWMYIKAEDIALIAKSAIAGQCSICMEQGGAEQTCQLRKRLVNLVDEPQCAFGCGFRGGNIA